MTLLDRLFGFGSDPHAATRPLWHAAVIAARDPHWYSDLGVADTVPGRFDMVTIVLALVLLRLEDEPDSAAESVRLTEMFVEDMDAQLRQSGVGDLMVGKHVGKLMATLGGRLGSLRDALPNSEEAPLREAVERNVTLEKPELAGALARQLKTAAQRLAEQPVEELHRGRLPQLAR